MPAVLVLLMALAVLVIFDYPGRSVPDRLFRLQAGLRAVTASKGGAGAREALDMLLSVR